MNNGFKKKIGSKKQLQQLFEKQESDDEILEPTELINYVNEIIKNLKIENEIFKQKEYKIFNHKDEVPLKQFYALYAINKITSLANKKCKSPIFPTIQN